MESKMGTKASKELVKDVVCGMAKPQDRMPFKSDFSGKTYYFCSQKCKEMFDIHPDRWVKGGGNI